MCVVVYVRLPEDNKPILPSDLNTAASSPASPSTVVMDSNSVPHTPEDTSALLSEGKSSDQPIVKSELPPMAAPAPMAVSRCARPRRAVPHLQPSHSHRLQFRHRRSTRRLGLGSAAPGCLMYDSSESTPTAG